MDQHDQRDRLHRWAEQALALLKEREKAHRAYRQAEDALQLHLCEHALGQVVHTLQTEWFPVGPHTSATDPARIRWMIADRLRDLVDRVLEAPSREADADFCAAMHFLLN